MIRYRRTYRMLAVVTVAAMTWALGLPVIHYACAMMAPVEAGCSAHERGDHAESMPGDADAAGALDIQAHEHRSAHARGDVQIAACTPVDDLSPACCFFEADTVDRQATPAQTFDKHRLDALATAAIATALLDHRPPPAVPQSGPASAPPLPFSSPASLSVFLI